jgi:hypothetical protein
MTIPDEKKLQEKTIQSKQDNEKFLQEAHSNRRKEKVVLLPKLNQQKAKKTDVKERTAPEKLRVKTSIKYQQRTKENIHPKHEIKCQKLNEK